MKILKKIPLYIKFYKNRIVIDRLDNGKSKEKLANFSNSRILCGDLEIMINTLTEVIEVLCPKEGIFANNYDAVLHQLEMNEEGLSSVEMRTLRDAAEHQDIIWMKIIEHENEISHMEAKKILADKR